MGKRKKNIKKYSTKVTAQKVKRTPVKAKDQSAEELFAARNAAFGASLTAGGITNPLSGAGTIVDKGESYFYLPTRITTRTELEILYIQSWAARSFIDIPIDDMFIRGRDLTHPDKGVITAFQEAGEEFKLVDRFSRAMKAGRLYGTGIMVIMTREAPPDKPLRLDRMRKGDLSSVLVLDRFDCSVLRKDPDPYSNTYGEAETYQINLTSGGSMAVHASRVFRFDGRSSLSMTGWYNYEQDWGVSEIIAAITEIHSDGGLAKGCSHLAQEASIPIVKIKDFEDALKSQGGQNDAMSLTEYAQTVNQFKSIYRTVFMDSEGDMSRLNVSFAGLPELMDKQARRLAACAMIPATRFWGQSPVGMNATGDSDMANYAIMVKAMQESKLRHNLKRMDLIMARHLGIDSTPDFDFPSLVDISDIDQSAAFLSKSTAVSNMMMSNLIDEDEGRAIMSKDPLVGELGKRQISFQNRIPEGDTGAVI